MQWLEISISVDHDAVEAVAEMLMRYGANGVEIDDPRLMLERQTSVGDWDYAELPPDFDPDAEVIVRAWLQIGPDTPDALRQLEQELRLMPEYGLTLGSGSLAMKEVEDQNWAEVWKAYFKPLRVGEKLVVKPAWEDWQGEDDIVIELDPGLAFGTGNHATTKMVLTLLERYLSAGQEVIDVGCGSGILSVAAAKLGAGRIEAIDIDRLAVESTEANLALNGLSGAVSVRQGDLLQHSRGSADLILANIIADVIIRLLQDVSRVLKPGGILICSGIIGDRRKDVEQALAAAGFTMIEALSEDDWVAIAARSPVGVRE